jgi:hypothetical protein
MNRSRAVFWGLGGAAALSAALVISRPTTAAPERPTTPGVQAPDPGGCELLTLAPTTSPQVIRGPGVLEAVIAYRHNTPGLVFEGLRGQTRKFIVHSWDAEGGSSRLELNVAFDGDLTVSAFDGRGPEAYLIIRRQ